MRFDQIAPLAEIEYAQELTTDQRSEVKVSRVAAQSELPDNLTFTATNGTFKTVGGLWYRKNDQLRTVRVWRLPFVPTLGRRITLFRLWPWWAEVDRPAEGWSFVGYDEYSPAGQAAKAAALEQLVHTP